MPRLVRQVDVDVLLQLKFEELHFDSLVNLLELLFVEAHDVILIADQVAGTQISAAVDLFRACSMVLDSIDKRILLDDQALHSPCFQIGRRSLHLPPLCLLLI